jgi:6-phosphofructokinase 1
VLGHVQRGGTPSAYDRVLATRFGVAAMDAVNAGHFAVMVALQATEIVEVPLADALREPKLLDPAFYEAAEVFFA